MRLHFIAVLGLISVAFANAGEIQLGGVNGLTYNYITQQAGAVCAAGVGNCFAGSTGGNAGPGGTGNTGFLEKNYDVKLFQGANESSVMPVPYTGYQQLAGAAGTLGQFAMINDGTGASGNSNNFWFANSSGAQTIVVPVGISNVTDVSTMLNNVWGAAGGTDTTVTFDFGASSKTSTFDNVVVVTLTNAPSGTSGSPGGQIAASIACAQTTICTFANQDPLTTSVASATLNGNPTGGVIVDDATPFGTAYNSITSGVYLGSSGTVNLDSQDFLLSQLVAPSAGEFLVNIKVTELVGGAGVSGTALSAVTVGTVPEPSTVMLFLSGLGALGIARFRRKA